MSEAKPLADTADSEVEKRPKRRSERDRRTSYASDEERSDHRPRRDRDRDRDDRYRPERRGSTRDEDDDRDWRERRTTDRGSRRYDEHREKRRRTSRSPRGDRRDRSLESHRSSRRERSPVRDKSPRRDRSRDRDRERRHRDRDGEDRRSSRRDRSPSDRKDRDRSPRERRHKDRDSDRHRSHRSRRSPRPRSRSRDRDGQQPSIASGTANSTSAITHSRKAAGPLPDQALAFRGVSDNGSRGGSAAPVEKEQVNMGNTGILAKLTNTVETSTGQMIQLRYQEPPDARKCAADEKWKMYVFKGAHTVDTIELHTRSCWLIGKEESIVDYVAGHPSISKQHAVVQFRWIRKKDQFGDDDSKVKPYLIDLGTKNGTVLNGERIEGERFYELMDKDLIKLGGSEREYVVILPPKELI